MVWAFKVLAAGEAVPHAREVLRAPAGELGDNVEQGMLGTTSFDQTLAVYTAWLTGQVAGDIGYANGERMAAIG